MQRLQRIKGALQQFTATVAFDLANMKAFAALFVLLVVAVAAADDHEGHHHHGAHDYVVKTHADLLRYRDTCSTKLNVPADLVEKYKRWEYPDDEKTHCYMKCVFEEFGFFDEKSGFDVHKVHHQLVGVDGTPDHNDETHRKIEGCADKNTEGSDACAWAYRAAMCFIRQHLPLVQQSVKSATR